MARRATGTGWCSPDRGPSRDQGSRATPLGPDGGKWTRLLPKWKNRATDVQAGTRLGIPSSQPSHQRPGRSFRSQGTGDRVGAGPVAASKLPAFRTLNQMPKEKEKTPVFHETEKQQQGKVT